MLRDGLNAKSHQDPHWDGIWRDNDVEWYLLHLPGQIADTVYETSAIRATPCVRADGLFGVSCPESTRRSSSLVSQPFRQNVERPNRPVRINHHGTKDTSILPANRLDIRDLDTAKAHPEIDRNGIRTKSTGPLLLSSNWEWRCGRV